MVDKQPVILPTKCIGILGGGQLGRMLAECAQQMGYLVAILEPLEDCPAKYFANYHIQADYSDEAGLGQLAALADVITTEFENVPADAIKFLKKQGAKVYPDDSAIIIAQNRLREKTFFREIGLKTANFAAINKESDCLEIDESLLPGILKTSTLGYDGKGQRRVKTIAELRSAYNELGGECILEQLVALSEEVSIIVARNQTGSAVFPLIANTHINGILDTSIIPAQISPELSQEAHNAALKMVEKLNYNGILTIEFFITQDKQLLINEIAPRTHNSGHVTIEACVSSQFEQHLRAICGLPLGSVELKQKGIMLNLLGDLWQNPKADPFAVILSKPASKLHWYAKKEAKVGRKMGHVTMVANDTNELEKHLADLKQQLFGS